MTKKIRSDFLSAPAIYCPNSSLKEFEHTWGDGKVQTVRIIAIYVSCEDAENTEENNLWKSP
jgi:hypothetical protein